MNKKHAYLIEAHKYDLCFKSLLRLLDDSRNDIYIHMDAKCRDYDKEAVEKSTEKSKVYHIERSNITWGGFSQIRAELSLLNKAVEGGPYLYYHLLSGQDLPIKTQDQIHHFFELNEGKEFVRYHYPDFRFRERVGLYHLFQDRLGRNNSCLLNRLFLFSQKKIGINRNRDCDFYKGTNWFSITDDFARYIIAHEGWVRKVFKYTLCCDEVFIQTLLMMSPYKDNRYWMPMDNNMNAIMRLIDWERGTPYTFTNKDWDEIMASEMLFCRKFDETVDSEIINRLFLNLRSQA